MEIETLGFPAKVTALEQGLNRMDEDKAGRDDVEDELNKLNHELKHRLADVDKNLLRLDVLEDGMDRTGKSLVELDEKVDEAVAGTMGYGEQIEGIKKVLTENYATNTEVQAMVKDVLLIWYSIKQLDATKADKKDMEAYALEQINRERSAIREDILERTGVMREEIATCVGDMETLSQRSQDQGTQFVNCQNMLGNLAGFLEELVLKIAEMQGVTVEGGAAGHGVQEVATVEDMGKWIQYAKGVVDQSLDAYHRKQDGGGGRHGRTMGASSGSAGGLTPGGAGGRGGGGRSSSRGAVGRR